MKVARPQPQPGMSAPLNHPAASAVPKMPSPLPDLTIAPNQVPAIVQAQGLRMNPLIQQAVAASRETLVTGPTFGTTRPK
jgi:hypothetical protein